MSALSIRCIKAAFLFLAIGIGLGAAFAIDRSLGATLRPLHAQLNLWGWVTLLIYGMGYHMLPRFAGRPLRSTRLADIQSWLAIGGTAFSALAYASAAPRPVLAAGALIQALAVLLFARQILPLLRTRAGKSPI